MSKSVKSSLNGLKKYINNFCSIKDSYTICLLNLHWVVPESYTLQ